MARTEEAGFISGWGLEEGPLAGPNGSVAAPGSARPHGDDQRSALEPDGFYDDEGESEEFFE